MTEPVALPPETFAQWAPPPLSDISADDTDRQTVFAARVMRLVDQANQTMGGHGLSPRAVCNETRCLHHLQTITLIYAEVMLPAAAWPRITECCARLLTTGAGDGQWSETDLQVFALLDYLATRPHDADDVLRHLATACRQGQSSNVGDVYRHARINHYDALMDRLVAEQRFEPIAAAVLTARVIAATGERS